MVSFDPGKKYENMEVYLSMGGKKQSEKQTKICKAKKHFTKAFQAQ